MRRPLCTRARPYAKAIGAFAGTSEERTRWLSFLQALSDRIRDPLIHRWLTHPWITSRQRLAGLEELMAPLWSPKMERLVLGLSHQNRLSWIPAIAEQFEKLCDREDLRCRVEVHTAFALDLDQESQLTAALASRLQRHIQLHQVIDPGLKVGLMIRIGSHVIEYSGRQQLAALREHLRAGGRPHGKKGEPPHDSASH